ncbi:MAG: T9SS type A sorting domain-containing protein [Bacteroidota bacterium]
MKTKIILLTLLLNPFMFIDLLAQTMPLVYDVENTGADYPNPPIPSFNQLPTIQALPDPFEWADGRGRISNFSDWQYRRAEIKAQIENYEIGTKPAVDIASQVTASYSGNTLTVNVTANGQTLTLTCAVVLPSGSGPFPAVIGMLQSIPSTVFSSRNIAQITFNYNQVTTDGSANNTNPYYRLYPYLNIDNTGQYSAWAWGVSRIIDGLELVQNVLPIDLKHIAVSGCSRGGKMALFAGALDERVALTIAQESGGGGATSWRYSQSEPNGTVEKIDNTDYNWFRNSMNQFSGNNVSRLPEDHHELMAMCAPRALYVTANPDFTWLSNPSCYVCSKACQPVYSTLGIADRFGFSVVGGHNHCQVPSNQIPEIGAFVDKFLLGIDTVNTNIADTPYTTDLSPWITWTTPTLSNGTSFVKWASLIYPSNLQKDLDKTITFKWNKVEDAQKYFIQLSLDQTFTQTAASDSTTLDTVKTITGLLDGKRYSWRVQAENNAGTSGPFSEVWTFTTYVPLPAMPQLIGAFPSPGQPGWVTFKWNKVQNADQYFIQLSHTQDFSFLFYSDSTASDTSRTVAGFSEGLQYYWRVQAKNVEGSSPWSASNFTVDVKDVREGEIPTEYSISQNYPNPFNPTTKIGFALPQRSLTRLIIYDLLGREVQTLIDRELQAGYYEINIDINNFPSGIYFYTLKSGDYFQTKKMVLMK